MLRKKIMDGMSESYLATRRLLGKDRARGVYFVVPETDWVLDRVGKYITRELTSQFGLKAKTIGDPRRIVGQILHYGSLWEFLANLGGKQNERNRIVATVFHGDRSEGVEPFVQGLESFLEHQNEIERLVTSNSIMRNRFVEWGVPEEKIACIPLGVDLSIFGPASEVERVKVRRELGIPADGFCIGSFQKDGKGWEEGLEPKLTKGPDVLLAVCNQLRKAHKLHVLLTAPARGFVKQGLAAMGVSFTHVVMDDHKELVNMYGALDAYLVSSREEGGPEGILEALASGVPLVSTRVGMAEDVVVHGKEALLADVEDVDGLAGHLSAIVEDEELRKRLVANGLIAVREFDWPKLAARYYHEVYKPLLGY